MEPSHGANAGRDLPQHQLLVLVLPCTDKGLLILYAELLLSPSAYYPVDSHHVIYYLLQLLTN